jgi:hypothetical protein
VTDDFDVTIFLTELSTRHSLLTKHKQFSDKPKLKSTGNKLTGWLNNSENPIHLDDDEVPPEILQEDDDVPELQNIPDVNERSKRSTAAAGDDEALFVSSDDEEFFATQRERSSKRRKRNDGGGGSEAAITAEQDQDDKKKLAMNTSYDGFSIYGRILCLLVKRKGKKAPSGGTAIGGSQMMEQWMSTQAAQEAHLDDDEDG